MALPDLISITGAGAAFVVGTVAPDGTPRATRGWAASWDADDPTRLRVLITADDDVTTSNLADGSRVAITVADVRTFASLQVKGEVVATGPPDESDLARFEDQSDRLVQAVEATDGTPPALFRRLFPHRLLRIDVAVDERFDQSPGPRAGTALPERRAEPATDTATTSTTTSTTGSTTASTTSTITGSSHG